MFWKKYTGEEESRETKLEVRARKEAEIARKTVNIEREKRKVNSYMVESFKKNRELLKAIENA